MPNWKAPGHDGVQGFWVKKWLKDSRLKGNTESMVFAIQDQAIKTRYIEIREEYLSHKGS